MNLFISVIVLFSGMLAFSATHAQTVIKLNKKYGLADNEGNVIIKPESDSIFAIIENYFIVIKNGKCGITTNQYSKVRAAFTINGAMHIADDKEIAAEWKSSPIEFDKIFYIGEFDDKTKPEYFDYVYKGRNCNFFRRKFIVFGYLKNSKYGTITYEKITRQIFQKHDAKTGSESDSLLFSLENMTITSPQYDYLKYHQTVEYGTRKDQRVVFGINNKYGMFIFEYDTLLNAEYDKPPVFKGTKNIYPQRRSDDIRIQKYYSVRKNSKEGLICFEEGKIIQAIPCKFDTLINVSNSPGEKYYSIVQNDSLTLFDIGIDEKFNAKNFEYTLALPFSLPPDLLKKNMGVFEIRNVSSSIAVIVKTKRINDDFQSSYYVADIQTRKITAYQDTAYQFEFIQAGKNSLILKTTYLENKTQCIFYHVSDGSKVGEFYFKGNLKIYHKEENVYDESGRIIYLYISFYWYDEKSRSDKKVLYYINELKYFLKKEPNLKTIKKIRMQNGI